MTDRQLIATLAFDVAIWLAVVVPLAGMAQ